MDQLRDCGGVGLHDCPAEEIRLVDLANVAEANTPAADSLKLLAMKAFANN